VHNLLTGHVTVANVFYSQKSFKNKKTLKRIFSLKKKLKNVKKRFTSMGISPSGILALN